MGSEIQFQHDAWRRLLLQSGGSSPIPVEPVRCFPLTHPDEHISLVDPEGREVLRIAALSDLPAEQRQVLEQELAEREFSPRISRIVRAGVSLPCSWDVETDRGSTRFDIDSEDDFRRLPDGTVIIADSNGIRFRIPNVDRLDAPSKAILRRFL